MFTLADKFSFPPDPQMCFLAAAVGFSEAAGLVWHLKLHSSSLIAPRNPQSPWDGVAVGIDCRNLRFRVSDWKDLRGSSFEVPEGSLSCAFQVVHWEDLVSIRLAFGETRGNAIEVFADGIGLAESALELFANPEVSFSIDTWAKFLGVSVNVPVNAADFMAYALDKVERLLPGYLYGEPTVRRAADSSGTLRGVEVFYGPK